MNELRHLRPGVQEAVDLEGYNGSRVESQGARVLQEVGQHPRRVEETDHRDAGRYIHRVHVIAIDQGIETW